MVSWSTSPPNSARSGPKDSPTTPLTPASSAWRNPWPAKSRRKTYGERGRARPRKHPLVIDNLSEEWREDKAAELPLGRFGEPHEVAETISCLEGVMNL